jgi:drug/metabolite transporter (DMT)-like permease
VAVTLGVFLGLAGAIAWGLSGLVGTSSTRLLGSSRSLGWGVLAGFVLVATPALATIPHRAPTGATTGWLVLGAACSFSGLSVMMAAYRRGPLAVVAPIIACEGAVIAIADTLLGTPLPVGRALLLVLATLGVVAVAGGARRGEATSIAPRTILLAIAAAVLYGIGLLAASRASREVGPYAPALATRVVGITLLTLPMLVRSRGEIPPRAGLRLALLGGALDVAGMLLYIGSARVGSAAVAGVLVSQAAAVSVVLGLVVLRERLERLQVAGFLTIALAVGALGYGA